MLWWIACSQPTPVPPCATGDCRPDLAEIAVGDEFGCARRYDGTVECWGRNQAGQLGSGDFAERERTQEVLADARAISAGQRHACALRTDGQVTCWGANERGQVSREPGDWAGPRAVPLPGPMVEVAAGWTTTCARDEKGVAWCWGDDIPSPRRVAGVVATRLANGRTPCALEADGAVACWPGAKVERWALHADHLAVDREIAAWADGRILLWTPGQEPREVGRVAGATGLAVVRGGVYASSQNGELWGFTTGEGKVPLPVPRAEAVAGRGHSACARSTRGVECWGPDAAGRVPRGILRPRQLDGRGEVFAGGAGTCLLGETTTCYAENGLRTLGLGPVAWLALGDRGQWLVRPDGRVESWDRDGGEVALPGEQLSGGDRLVCSRQAGGTVWCADAGAAPVARDLGARAIAVGGRFACAVSGAGEVRCWEGADGPPHVIPGLPPVSQVAVGSNLACAAEGGVWCWNHWRSGLGASTAPVAVGVERAAAIAVGMAHGCALTEDGGVWCWGANERGQLGDGTTRGRTAAALVSLPGPAAKIDLGHSHACAQLEAGPVWCWGHPGGLGEHLAENAPDQVVLAPVR